MARHYVRLYRINELIFMKSVITRSLSPQHSPVARTSSLSPHDGENEPVGIHTHAHVNVLPINCHCHDSLPGYHKILRSNYTFYLLDKLDLTPEQANTHKLNLIGRYKRQQHINESQGKFIISF